eukprot:TRINITY_DN8100_c0_g5_i1.p1 TRINITY_DN8100_c0_g5~~TRINITY_DN8100_c0_g5_i1.p1  ORF type:complete len:255 (-),score=79.50 TRINITY_DN8100_c0_g5_i1:76-840(-)
MCNASTYPHLESRGEYDLKTQSFIVKSLGKIPPAKQMILNYGPYKNEDLLMNYGFVEENNPYDYFTADIVLDEHDGDEDDEQEEEEKDQEAEEIKNKKDALWKASGLNWGDSPLEIPHLIRRATGSNEAISPKLYAALRLSFMDEEELSQAMKSLDQGSAVNKKRKTSNEENDSGVFDLRDPISDRNETKVLEFLVKFLDQSIEAISDGKNDMESDYEEEDNNIRTLHRWNKIQLELLQSAKDEVLSRAKQFTK